MIQNITGSMGSISYLEVLPTPSLWKRTTDVALSRMVSKAPASSFHQYFVSAVVIAVLAFVVYKLIKITQDDKHFPFAAPVVNPPLRPVNPPLPPLVVEAPFQEFEAPFQEFEAPFQRFEAPFIAPSSSVFFTVQDPTADDLFNFSCYLSQWIEDWGTCSAFLKLIKNDAQGLVLVAYLGYEQGQEKMQAKNLYRALYKSVNEGVEPPKAVRFERLVGGDGNLEVDGGPYWTSEQIQCLLESMTQEESMDQVPARGYDSMSEEDDLAAAIRESEELEKTTKAQEEELANTQLTAALRESEKSLENERKLVVPETRELIPFMGVCFTAFQRTQLYTDALKKTEAVNMPIVGRLVDPVVNAFMDYLAVQNVPTVTLVHEGSKKRLNAYGIPEIIEIYFRFIGRDMIC